MTVRRWLCLACLRLARALRPKRVSSHPKTEAKRVLDLEKSGARVFYTTPKHYDEALALAGKRRAKARDVAARKVAAKRQTTLTRSTVTPFRKAK